jgi:hypothetical protein
MEKVIKDGEIEVCQMKVNRVDAGIEVWIKSKIFEEFFMKLHPKNPDGSLAELKRSSTWGINYYTCLPQTDAPRDLLVNHFGSPSTMMADGIPQASFIRAQGIGRDEIKDPATGEITDKGGTKVLLNCGELINKASISRYREALGRGLANFYRDYIAPVNVSVRIVSRDGR